MVAAAVAAPSEWPVTMSGRPNRAQKSPKRGITGVEWLSLKILTDHEQGGSVAGRQGEVRECVFEGQGVG